MIDVGRADAEAGLWGIALTDWMELQVRIFGRTDVFGQADVDDPDDERWRERVAEILVQNRLFTKASRFLECCRYAYRYACLGVLKHLLFSPIYCDLRFCPRCAGRQFARLIQKYEPILAKIWAKRRRGFAFREITLTTRNTGKLSPAQNQQFNRDVKGTLKALMPGIKGWGAIWCDEVGFENTNLHAHILFYGPFISQKQLAAMWKKVSGHEVVWIAPAHGRGAKVLVHLLKYVAKPPANDADQIGRLEVAFHKTRRVHALGVFYNFVGDDTDEAFSEWTTCPHCGSEIEKEQGAVRIERAILEGRTFVGTKQTERRKKWVN